MVPVSQETCDKRHDRLGEKIDGVKESITELATRQATTSANLNNLTKSVDKLAKNNGGPSRITLSEKGLITIVALILAAATGSAVYLNYVGV